MDSDDKMAVYRANAAAAEILLLREISQRQLHGYKFRRQLCSEPMVVEFVCAELKLVVELYSDTQNESVHCVTNRTRVMECKGYQVARFCHYEVMNNLMGVIDQLGVAVRQCKKAVAMSKLACRYLSGGTSRPVFGRKTI